MSTARNVIIIGSGPAGLTAAIYTARASLAPLVIEGELSSTSDQPGGQLMLTTEVENFPGFPTGIMGPELMSNFRDQAERFGTEFITDKATRVDFSARPFRVYIRDTEYTANSIIVSTGAQSLMLGLPEEESLIGHGLSTCATCDGFFFAIKKLPLLVVVTQRLKKQLFLQSLLRRFISLCVEMRCAHRASCKTVLSLMKNRNRVELSNHCAARRNSSDGGHTY